MFAEQTQGAYILSIGTSLVFETLLPTTAPAYDPERIVPPQPDLTKYNEMWINVSTLIRNLLGSLPKEIEKSVSTDEIANAVLEEIDFIISLWKNEGQGIIKPVFYACEYNRIVSMTAKPLVALRMDNTELQKMNRVIHNQALAKIFSQLDPKDPTYKKFNNNIKPTKHSTNVLLLSHYAYDLTNAHSFNRMDLIESHTGVIKDKFHFYTKMYNGNELDMIPFLKGFLMIFGDKEHFKSLDMRLRKDIVELARKYHWSQVTSLEKVKYCLDDLKNHYYREIIKTIFNNP